MYKTSVYTFVNSNIQVLAQQNSKSYKRWYCPHHTRQVSMCCWIISPFVIFASFEPSCAKKKSAKVSDVWVSAKSYISDFQPGFHRTQGFHEHLPMVSKLACSKTDLACEIMPDNVVEILSIIFLFEIAFLVFYVSCLHRLTVLITFLLLVKSLHFRPML